MSLALHLHLSPPVQQLYNLLNAFLFVMKTKIGNDRAVSYSWPGTMPHLISSSLSEVGIMLSSPIIQSRKEMFREAK